MQFTQLKEARQASFWGVNLSDSLGSNIWSIASKDGSVEAKELFQVIGGEKSDRSCHFLTTNSYSQWKRFAKVWDKISLTAKEEKVVKALGFIDPEIEAIDFRRTNN